VSNRLELNKPTPQVVASDQ